jgi:hypothetical protein
MNEMNKYQCQEPISIMKKEEIAAIIESVAQQFPARTSGNEQIKILATRLADFVQTERPAVVELLREWLAIRIPQSERNPEDGKREFWMWLALDVAKKYGLAELRYNIETLIADVRSGKTFLPYYEDMIAKYH